MTSEPELHRVTFTRHSDRYTGEWTLNVKCICGGLDRTTALHIPRPVAEMAVTYRACSRVAQHFADVHEEDGPDHIKARQVPIFERR